MVAKASTILTFDNSTMSRAVPLRRGSHRGEGANGEGPSSLDLRWYCGEREPARRQSVEVHEMLDDRDLGAEQHSVDWTFAAGGAVDVQRVDTDAGDTSSHERLGRLFAEVG